MKNKYNILLFGVALLFVTSCNDITDLKPLDSLTDSSYWRNVDDLQKYAENFYGNLSGPSASLDNTSDNKLTGSYDTWLYNEITQPSSGGGWDWGNIRRLNYFMTRYHTATGDPKQINKYVGMIRFFRALDYFGKIKTFGDVPWYETDLQITDKDLLYKKRDSRDFVLNKIIEDLEFAENNLPEKQFVRKGELHKDCARVMLSRVCLYFGTYKKYHNIASEPTSQALLNKSAKASKAIMDTQLYTIVKGTDSGASQQALDGYPLYYSNQFTQEDLTDNKECILPRIYIADLVTHELGRLGTNGFTKDFVESFLCNDGRPIANSDKYLGDEYLDQELVNRDPRMYQLIDNVKKPYIVTSERVQFSNSSQPGKSQYTAVGVSADASVTGYASVKYHSAALIQAEAFKSTFDWFIYRYAEVLLNYVEAKYELGECTQQILDATINQLRDRVDMPHLTMNPEVDKAPIDYGYSITPLLYEIRRERRIELVLEGFRYDDIIRWNAVKLFENPKTVLGMRVTDFTQSLYPQGTFGGENGRKLIVYQGKTYIYPYDAKKLDDPNRRWTKDDKRFLSPLPFDQLLLNKNLEQNPGWTRE